MTIIFLRFFKFFFDFFCVFLNFFLIFLWFTSKTTASPQRGCGGGCGVSWRSSWSRPKRTCWQTWWLAAARPWSSPECRGRRRGGDAGCGAPGRSSWWSSFLLWALGFGLWWLWALGFVFLVTLGFGLCFFGDFASEIQVFIAPWGTRIKWQSLFCVFLKF